MVLSSVFRLVEIIHARGNRKPMESSSRPAWVATRVEIGVCRPEEPFMGAPKSRKQKAANRKEEAAQVSLSAFCSLFSSFGLQKATRCGIILDELVFSLEVIFAHATMASFLRPVRPCLRAGSFRVIKCVKT